MPLRQRRLRIIQPYLLVPRPDGVGLKGRIAARLNRLNRVARTRPDGVGLFPSRRKRLHRVRGHGCQTFAIGTFNEGAMCLQGKSSRPTARCLPMRTFRELRVLKAMTASEVVRCLPIQSFTMVAGKRILGLPREFRGELLQGIHPRSNADASRLLLAAPRRDRRGGRAGGRFPLHIGVCSFPFYPRRSQRHPCHPWPAQRISLTSMYAPGSSSDTVVSGFVAPRATLQLLRGSVGPARAAQTRLRKPMSVPLCLSACQGGFVAWFPQGVVGRAAPFQRRGSLRKWPRRSRAVSEINAGTIRLVHGQAAQAQRKINTAMFASRSCPCVLYRLSNEALVFKR